MKFFSVLWLAVFVLPSFASADDDINSLQNPFKLNAFVKAKENEITALNALKSRAFRTNEKYAAYENRIATLERDIGGGRWQTVVLYEGIGNELATKKFLSSDEIEKLQAMRKHLAPQAEQLLAYRAELDRLIPLRQAELDAFAASPTGKSLGEAVETLAALNSRSAFVNKRIKLIGAAGLVSAAGAAGVAYFTGQDPVVITSQEFSPKSAASSANTDANDSPRSPHATAQ